MKSKTITYEKQEKIALITLHRPEKMNSLDSQTVIALRDIWIDFESDPDLRVSVITGTDKAFCTGIDLEEAGQGAVVDFNSCIPNYGVEVSKPIISAINGWTIGAGVGLVTGSDIKVMSDKAKIIFPEAKIGYAGGGVDQLNYMPYSVAMELWLTGDPLEAARAYEVGFVNRVVPPDRLMDTAMEFADKIKDNAPLTMKMLKMFAIEHTRSVKSQWLLMEARYIKPQLESQDFNEGVRAFKEKRKPLFKNK